MSRLELYREAKLQAQELGIRLPKRWNERGSTTDYWRRQVQKNNRNIRNRRNNYNRALRVARELRENLQIPNELTGTSNEDWIRELRRLRMRGRRGQTERAQQRTQQIQPVLREIPQLEQRRQQRIARQQERLNRFITNNNFQSVLNMAFNENVRLTMRQATTVWNNLRGSGRYLPCERGSDNTGGSWQVVT